MKYVGAKVAQAIPVLLLVTVATFLLVEFLPGDLAASIAGASATPEQIEAVRQELNLDASMPVRYVTWLGQISTGDFGRSVQTGQPVLEAIAQRLPVSLLLMTFAQVIALGIAIPVALVSALNPRGWFDRISGAISFALVSIPPFVFAVLLIFAVALNLKWLPATGYVPFSEDPLGSLKSLLLPAVALAGSLIATYHRVLRGDLRDTLQQDYLLMARAKGLNARYLLTRHALRPSSFSLITLAGLNVGRLISGAVIIEVIFALPGIGQLMVSSLFSRDFTVLQAMVLFTAVTFIVVNIGVDLLYAVIDPRVRDAKTA